VGARAHGPHSGQITGVEIYQFFTGVEIWKMKSPERQLVWTPTLTMRSCEDALRRLVVPLGTNSWLLISSSFENLGPLQGVQADPPVLQIWDPMVTTFSSCLHVRADRSRSSSSSTCGSQPLELVKYRDGSCAAMLAPVPHDGSQCRK